MTLSEKILVIDDDTSLLRALQIGLDARGYEVHVARIGREGVDQAALAVPSVVILDLGLPDMDGLEVVRQIRGWSAVPILVLSASDDEERKVAALDRGADDYLTKPFGMAELEARIRVALRHRSSRLPETTKSVFRSERLVVDFPSRSVNFDGNDVDLTAREFDLLGYLVRNVGKVCTHHMILRDVWGSGYGNEHHYLRVYANRLRKKLHDDGGEMIQTRPGVGYQLVVSDTED